MSVSRTPQDDIRRQTVAKSFEIDQYDNDQDKIDALLDLVDISNNLLTIYRDTVSSLMSYDSRVVEAATPFFGEGKNPSIQELFREVTPKVLELAEQAFMDRNAAGLKA